MKIYQTVLPVTLIILLAICSISYFTTNHIRSIRRLRESANKYRHIEHEEFLDLNDKETMKNILVNAMYAHLAAVKRNVV